MNTDSDNQNYAVFNQGMVSMQPFTLEPGDDITFTFWLKPDMAPSSGLLGVVFNIDHQMQLYATGLNYWQAFAGLWWRESALAIDFPSNPHLPTNDAAWPAGTEPGGTWSFVAYRIRVSDGFQSVSVNGNVIEEGIKQIVTHKAYGQGSLGSNSAAFSEPYLGGMSDFRMYKTYLSDEQLAAVQKGEPACSGPPPGKVFVKRKTKVNARMSIPLTVEEFDDNAQLEYRETVAAVVGVTPDQVTIVSVTAE